MVTSEIVETTKFFSV